MNEKKNEFKITEDVNLSAKSAENKANNNEEEFIIPNEAACSPEFAEGCFVMEDQAEDKED